MIRFAEDWMIPQLKKVWKECFHDEDSYIEFFFTQKFQCENTLVWLEEGKAAAMLHMLPASVVQGGGLMPIRYVYAVATLPEYRGRGISNRLLAYGNSWMEERKEFSILVPAEDSLFGFYEKQGYVPAFSLKRVRLIFTGKEEQSGKLEYKKTEPKQYQVIRDRHFMKEGYVSWGLDAIRYALAEYEFTKGFSWYFTYEKGEMSPLEGVLLGHKIGEKLIIKEIACEDSAIPEIMSMICKDMEVSEAEVRLPAYSKVKGKSLSYGMSFLSGTSDGYLGLALD